MKDIVIKIRCLCMNINSFCCVCFDDCFLMLFQLHGLLNFSWYYHEYDGPLGCVVFSTLWVDW